MLTTEPPVSIEVHNMRGNPNLVPEKMVAFKKKSQQERTKKTLFKGKQAIRGEPYKKSPNLVKSVIVPLLNVDRAR